MCPARSSRGAGGLAINTEETLLWTQGLLPGEKIVVTRQVNESFPAFTIVVAHLEGAQRETVSMTVDASRVDTLLQTEDGEDLRVELLLAHEGHEGVGADLLAVAATLIAEDPQHRSPQPGLLLPGLAGHVDGSITAKHAAFVVPFVWAEDGVPHVKEGAEGTHPGRMTVPLQMVLLTDEEFAIADEHGLDAVQQHVVANSINIHDLWRAG